MKVLSENSDRVTIEFDKMDLVNIQSFFFSREMKQIKDMCEDNEQFESIKKLVHLEDINKGLFDEIDRVLKEKRKG